MARLSILAVCLIAVFAYSVECTTIPDTFKSNYEVNYAQNLTDFLEANPGIKLQELERVEQFDEATNNYRFVHRFGHHENGDRVLATRSDRHEFGSYQNYRLQLNHPAYGTQRYTITYVEVIVDQSSNWSRGWILSGGIGYREISIVIESQQVYYFAYGAAVYGY